MRDTYEIGSSPNEEECAQVGSDNFTERAKRECTAYKNQLERAFPGMPGGMYLSVKSCPHDLGTYYDVVVHFDDEREDHSEFLWGKLEVGCDVWDDEARKELNLDGQTTPGSKRTPAELGYPDIESVEELVFASVVPACCSEGCQVEPDGKCQHGHPSILIELGII